MKTNKERRQEIRKEVKEKIAEAVIQTVQQDDVNADITAAKPITDAVADEVIPIAIHNANAEPWYQSRVTLGALIIIITRLLAHFGYAIPEELHGAILDIIIAFGPYAGVGLALWGRWIAKKPLGS